MNRSSFSNYSGALTIEYRSTAGDMADNRRNTVAGTARCDNVVQSSTGTTAVRRTGIEPCVTPCYAKAEPIGLRNSTYPYGKNILFGEPFFGKKIQQLNSEGIRTTKDR